MVKRQHGKCAVPSCKLAVFTDVHHLQLQSEGGTHDPDGLALLCSMHHDATHRGALQIEGTWSTGLTFRHADGSVYGAPSDPRGAAALSDVHQALGSLGFKEGAVRSLVKEVRPHVGASSSIEDLLRLALRASRPGEPRAGA